MSIEPIIIVGAGIAGLTCALALAQNGQKSIILEAFDEPQEVGAGIQIPPNAWRIFAKLGLEDAFTHAAIKPTAIRLGDAVSGKIVLDMKVNGAVDGATFATIHRASLHSILWDAAQETDEIDIFTGHKLDRIEYHSNNVELTCDTINGSKTLSCPLVIGADGIWSNVRRFVRGAQHPKSTGRIALRAIVPAKVSDDEPNVTAWMAPKAHIVAYPMRDEISLNIVAIINGAATSTKWNTKFDGPLPIHLAQALENITQTNPDEIEFMRWPLYACKPNGIWHSNQICLIGDAAHGMEPFAAQGAAMGVEDGFELAWYLHNSSNNAEAFAAFYAHRVGRVMKAAKRTQLNRFAYHQRGLGRWGRNLVFRIQPNQSFLESLDWLYGYKAKGL